MIITYKQQSYNVLYTKTPNQKRLKKGAKQKKPNHETLLTTINKVALLNKSIRSRAGISFMALSGQNSIEFLLLPGATHYNSEANDFYQPSAFQLIILRH